MPVARFELPNGRIGRFEVPDGTTPEEAHKAISDFLSAGGQLQTEKETVAQKGVRESNATTAELIAANPMTRVAVGAASPILGAMERLGITSPEGRRQLQAMQERGNAALGLGAGGMASDIAGNVMSPAWLGAAKAMPQATTMGQKIAQGAGLGALGGATTWGDNPMGSAAVGAALGGAIPPLGSLAMQGGGMVANMVPSIRKGNLYRAAAGDKAEEIIELLRKNEQLVPGSMPTAGQAASLAGRPEWAALQAQVSSKNPSQYAQRADEQSAAQLEQLQAVGKDKKTLTDAIKSRKDAANPLYETARNSISPVDIKPVVERINKLIRENPGNAELLTELQGVKKGLMSGDDLRTSAKEIVSTIDGLKARMADEKNKFIGGQLDDLKTSLEKSIPGYEQAQKVFREKSLPINQMQAGQYLENVATPTGYQSGAGTPLREAQFLEAIRKTTDVAGDDAAKRAADLFAKRVTGSPRFKELSELLEPAQMKAVEDVAADFFRNRKYIDQAIRGVGGRPEMKTNTRLPNTLQHEIMVANAIISKAEGKINEKLAAEIAVEMLNPPGVAENLHRAMRRGNMNKARADTLAAWMKSITPSLANQAGAVAE